MSNFILLVGEHFVTSRINHALGNGDCMSEFGEIVLMYANEGISNYTTLVFTP